MAKCCGMRMSNAHPSVPGRQPQIVANLGFLKEDGKKKGSIVY